MAVSNPTDAAAEAALRRAVREFVRAQFDRSGLVAHCDAWMSAFSPEFSRALAERGWIGMTWPVEQGGQARSERERLVVVEELLAAGAPVAAHWFADRQIGPGILKHGTEQQRQAYLPRIAAGECFFSIGMSEPDSGSDLASIRTRAVRSDEAGGGWVLNGAKVWTSHAHVAHHLLALVRTDAPDAERRHAGMSQLIVDLASPGVEVRPIVSLDGGHHFNQVLFTDVRLDDAAVLGQPGAGWAQVTAELAYERSGPERYLSTFPLLAELHRRGTLPAAVLGELAAELQTLRALSQQVADALGRSETPTVDAALVKDLGSRFERKVVDTARQWDPVEPDPHSDDTYTRLLTEAVQHSPDATLRGGTNEILRGIIAREVIAHPDPSAGTGAGRRSEVRSTIVELAGATDSYRADGSWNPDVARSVVRQLQAEGWLGVGRPAELGGQDGDLADAADVVAGLAQAGVATPLPEALIVANPLLRAAAVAPDQPDALTIPLPVPGIQHADGTVTVRAERVSWAGWADRLAVLVTAEPAAPAADWELVLIDPSDAQIEAGSNLADAPRDRVTIERARPVARSPIAGITADTVAALGALARAVQTTAALERILELTVAYCSQRRQFGKVLLTMPVLQHELAALAGEVSAARAATTVAVRQLVEAQAGLGAQGDVVPADAFHAIAVAKVRTGLAATAGARIAHQLHGAIGITREYELQRHTRAVWAWRDEYGSERHWATRLGDVLTADPATTLWALVTEL
jgi:alkylation response protein AidB-like acyl-CoA dehydrogenase